MQAGTQGKLARQAGKRKLMFFLVRWKRDETSEPRMASRLYPKAVLWAG